MRCMLVVSAFLGWLLFGGLAMLTMLKPQLIEHSAKGFIQQEVQTQVSERYEQLHQTERATTLAGKAARLTQRLTDQQLQAKQALQDNLAAKIAERIAASCGYDCEKRQLIEQGITGYLKAKIANADIVKTKLNQLITGRYIAVVERLLLDLQIFTISNALLFFMVWLLSLVKPQTCKHLLLPGGCLMLTTVVSSGFYLLGQNWFYTIIFNSYMGWSYLVWTLILFGFLLDIAINDARVTSIILRIIDKLWNALGIPC